MDQTAKRRLIITSAFVAAALAVLAVFVVLETRGEPERAEVTGQTDERLVREDSHVLTEADDADAPVLVEFLDFECEVCAAVYPYVEQISDSYAGDITVVARYFPLPGHPNSRTAAHAAEAAARQDKFHEMYQVLFERQSAWSHVTTDQSAVFRGYAEELGLDMDQYDSDVASDEVAERVQADYDDAISLQLSGTPSLFLDGESLPLTSANDLLSAVDEAVNGD